MSQITTHVLDTAIGKPANGVNVKLLSLNSGEWQELAKGQTNRDGRIADLLPTGDALSAGHYQMRFEVEEYTKRIHGASFYPYIEIVFYLENSGAHYHIPLLLSPFGYSTYRGS